MSGETTGTGAERESGERSGRNGSHTGATRAQWVVGICSSILVLSLLGFLLWEAINGTGRPPVITVRVERVLAIPGGYEIQVSAENTGELTAKALNLEGTLKRDTTVVETSTATIQYVPAHATRRAGLFFTRDPRDYTLEVRPVGYDRP